MSNPEIERDAVAARAYALYVRRGMKPGHEIDDWVEAERQLQHEAILEAVAKAPGPTAPPVPPPAPASPAEPPAAGTSSKKKRSKKRR